MQRYLALEARRSVGRAPAIGLPAGGALLGAAQVITPRLPGDVLVFLETAFRVRGLGAILLLNDHLAVYAVLFFVGAAQLLSAVVAPREERQLDLLLAKPVPARVFLAARVAPVLGSTAVLGGVLSVGCGLAVAPFADEATSVGGAIAGGLVLTALVAVLLALATAVTVGMRDSFQALITGLVLWLAPLIPTSVFLYRPDLFEARPWLADVLVLPAALLWHDATLPAVAAAGVVVAGALGVGLIGLAGWRLPRA